MFDPEHQAVICPQCRKPEVHFDSRIGFYCGSCDREFSPEEAKVFVENEVFRTEIDD